MHRAILVVRTWAPVRASGPALADPVRANGRSLAGEYEVVGVAVYVTTVADRTVAVVSG
jgi:hypothetical protein